MCSMKSMKNSYGRGDEQQHSKCQNETWNYVQLIFCNFSICKYKETEVRYNMYIDLAEQEMIKEKDKLIEEASAKTQKRKKVKRDGDVHSWGSLVNKK